MSLLSRLSTRAKFFSVFFIFILIPSMVVGMVNINVAKNVIKQQMRQDIASNVQLFNKHISSYINSRNNSVDFLAKLANANYLQNPAQIDNILADMNKTDPSFMNVYIGTASGQMLLRPIQSLPAKYDPRVRPWYKEAMQKPNKVIITSPYQDAITKNMVVTIAESTSDNSGVAAIDINLKTLTDVAKTTKIGHNGYFQILDGIGNFVASPNGQAGAIDKESFVKQLYKQDSGLLQTQTTGNLRDIHFVTNPDTGWKIMGIVAQNEYSQAAGPILSKTLFIILLALILGGILSYFVVRLMTRSLHSLVDFAHQVAEGDLTGEIKVHSQDEFGKLSESFNQMVKSLRSVAGDVSTASEQLSAAAEELSAGAAESSLTTEHVTMAVQETSAGAENEARQVESNTQKVSEMTEVMEHIANNSTKASSSAVEALGVASNGSNAMESAAKQMSAVHASVSELEQSIKKLGKRSQQIEEIVSVITGIAGQTNLLSLNAAIEAARAGESGRGFAVVAAEVRKLAEQSTLSAKQISEVIQGIQSEIGQAVITMEASTKEVAAGMSTVNTAGQSFKQIEGSVQTVVNEIQEVSAAVQQMSAGTEELRVSMQEISKITESTSESMQTVAASAEEQLASMEEITASAESLGRMAEKLQELIQVFKV